MSVALQVDPIIVYAMEQLGFEDKTVRDPVHGDIMLNHLEVPVIDTERFQRLRRLRQLGTAHFVYPGAEHSRFQHSLGTLHMAQQLLRNIRENRFSEYARFGNPIQDTFFSLVVRLGALIHDLDEFPLSHVLEKEGSIFRRQWEDDNNNITLLGSDSEIYRAIQAKTAQIMKGFSPGAMTATSQVPSGRQVTFNRATASPTDIELLSRRLAVTLIVYTYKLIRNSNEDALELTRRLFKSTDLLVRGLVEEKFLTAGNQIVLNTVSADLLDYSRRDFFFCGIGKKYDERFLKYATVVSSGNTPVFGYRLVSKRKEIKSSVLSSLFDVLELRYALAEFVHTHHTKNVFSAMAIEAFSFYYHSLDTVSRTRFINDIQTMGDDELIYYIRDKNEGTRHILGHYYERNPYVESVLLRKWNPTEPALKVLRDPQQRMFLEKCIVEWFNRTYPPGRLIDGDVLVYAMPPPEDLYKELDTFVVYLDPNRNPKVEKMSTISRHDEPYPAHDQVSDTVINRVIKQRQELIDKYGQLWRGSAYLCPDISAELNSHIGTMVEELFSSLQYQLKIPETPQIPAELFETLVRVTQGARRGFRTFKDLFEALSAN